MSVSFPFVQRSAFGWIRVALLLLVSALSLAASLHEARRFASLLFARHEPDFRAALNNSPSGVVATCFRCGTASQADDWTKNLLLNYEGMHIELRGKRSPGRMVFTHAVVSASSTIFQYVEADIQRSSIEEIQNIEGLLYRPGFFRGSVPVFVANASLPKERWLYFTSTVAFTSVHLLCVYLLVREWHRRQRRSQESSFESSGWLLSDSVFAHAKYQSVAGVRDERDESTHYRAQGTEVRGATIYVRYDWELRPWIALGGLAMLLLFLIVAHTNGVHFSQRVHALVPPVSFVLNAIVFLGSLTLLWHSLPKQLEIDGDSFSFRDALRSVSGSRLALSAPYVDQISSKKGTVWKLILPLPLRKNATVLQSGYSATHDLLARWMALWPS